MVNRLISPYTIYIASFGCALLLYPLYWSDYYSPLQGALIFFLLLSFLFGWIAHARFANKSSDEMIAKPGARLKPALVITTLLYGFWILEFINAGGVPAYLILVSAKFDYRFFGIPTLHVFLVTFSSFYVSYLFHRFLHSRNRAILLLYFINLLPALLIFNRGMLLINLSTSMFIYLSSFHTTRFSDLPKKLPLWITVFIATSFLFGVLGTIRASQGSGQFYDRLVPYEIGRASSAFRNSLIPSEFFWFYLYFTSPIANLQQTIDKSHPEISLSSIAEWGTNEILPDALSKRISAAPRKDNAQIAHHLNASTVYARSFAYLGWLGMALMNLLLIGLPFLYRIVLGTNSKYYVTGMALLNSLYLFLIFDNMISFTGFSFQLAYPIFGSWVEKWVDRQPKE